MLLGYLFTACSYLLYAISRFCKRKQMILLFDLASKPFMALSLYYFNSLSGAYIFFVICFMLIVANIKEKMHFRCLIGYLFFQTLYLIILYYTYTGYSSALITLCVSITLFSIWWLPPQKMRLVGGFNGLLSLTYHLSIHNWLGLFEIASIASNFLAYHKRKK